MHLQSFGWRSIRVRLYLLFSLTLLGVMGYALSDAWSSWHTLQRLQQMQALEQSAQRISAVVHSLQKERGLSAGWIGAQGKRFASELASQRDATDAAHQVLRRYLAEQDQQVLGAAALSALGEADRQLNAVLGARAGISALTVSARPRHLASTPPPSTPIWPCWRKCRRRPAM